MLVAAVAAIDSELQQSELDLLNQWMEAFKVSAKTREKVLRMARDQQLSQEAIERLETHLAKTDLAYSLMLDMLNMATADGILMDEEKMLLMEVADSLDIRYQDFNILCDFVQSANQACDLQSPEPLFEHNIQSAFELLKDKNVAIFPHTLLCVSSPQFDRQLKERWYSTTAA